jgi:CheY-like chemotaxis protein
VSLGALGIAGIHLWKPDVQIDSITVVLLIVAVLPWAQPLVKSIDAFGVRIELQELKNRLAEAQEDAKGASEQASLALKATGAIAQLGGRRVLWVDDNPQNNEQGIRALQAQGIEVVTGKTTQEALEQAQGGRFDVIITDQLRYEDGIRKDRAGYELIGQLQKRGIKVPVILSSASPNREEAHTLGFYDTATTQQGVFELAMKAILSAA